MSDRLEDKWGSLSPKARETALLLASQTYIRGQVGNDDVVPITVFLKPGSGRTREDIEALSPSVEILPNGSQDPSLKDGVWTDTVCDGVRLTNVEDYNFLLTNPDSPS